jgi:hypothetical protein
VVRPLSDITATYVDNMGVDSNSWEEHLVNLRRFFAMMKKAGLTLNLAKSEFTKSTVKLRVAVTSSTIPQCIAGARRKLPSSSERSYKLTPTSPTEFKSHRDRDRPPHDDDSTDDVILQPG